MIDRLSAGEHVPGSELDANQMRVGWLAFAGLVVSVACIVLFIRWLHLAYRNVDPITPGHRRFDTGWAIGSWFVPFLNLVRPMQIVADVYRSGVPYRRRLPAWLVLWWLGFWGLWIYNRVADADPIGGSLAEMRKGTDELIVGCVLFIAMIGLAVCVVRSLTKRQEARADEVAAKPRTLRG